ncbi:MAG: FAD-binding oxidoreductase, partial [Bacteroidota bacterium]
QYQESNGYSLRSKLFAYNTTFNRLGSKMPSLTNAVYKSSVLGGLLKKSFGVAQERDLPKVYRFDFGKHLKNQKNNQVPSKRKVVLYIDEFTNYLDVEIGKDAIDLLVKLGYDVALFHAESGRTFLSKGFLKQAKELAQSNLERMKDILDENLPILGIEPSAILSFRDEYKRLCPQNKYLKSLAQNTFLIEEFLANEIKEEKLSCELFTEEAKEVKIHNHCHQKALSNQKVTFDILNLPKNYKVSIISSGCCGMAGSFGYEKEHYKTSMQVGELKLFPSVRKASPDTIISANGTSCRHQIMDGTKRQALHPVSILKSALKN